ncbi:MAG: glutaminase A [Porticoccaceae bacterium]
MQCKGSEFVPFQAYLEQLHARLTAVNDGAVASYIPELALANADWFGIALVTVDGHVYQVGDSREQFTVQSISKALVYGMALEDRGIDGVFAKVGVEPSGEAFNSISLEPETGRPLNPMINAGAIATTGLINAESADDRLACILKRFEKYTGHAVSVDDAVYRSERDTGHRNRAISHLLRNAEILGGVPEEVLDTYFRQCAIQVTARDLAIIGACLANNGVNPITGVVALEQPYVEKVLSVMSTCGMYDYSGQWLFEVGMPAKSGVGGGIMAVLPGQFGLGIFSPPLDKKGNSVRGIRVCEELSRDYGVHLFQVARASSSSVLRLAYDAAKVSSRRVHYEYERAVLRDHGARIRVFELQGELKFASTDSVAKTLVEQLADTQFVIVDFRRVVEVDRASTRLFADLALAFAKAGKTLYFTGTGNKYGFRRDLAREAQGLDVTALLRFSDDDRALEWCEDQLVRQYAPTQGAEETVPLERQALCTGLEPAEIECLREICHYCEFQPGESLFRAGDEGRSLFMVLAGAVDIVVKSDAQRERRLNTLRAGMSLGEFALVTEGVRSAEARAIVATRCYEVQFADIDQSLQTKLLLRLAPDLARRLAKEARELQIRGGGE